MKLQDVGLDTTFKCPKCRQCRDCLRGPGKEKLSIQQEAEQQIIKDSVRIDTNLKRPVAHLAFIKEPKEHLEDNSAVAKKRLYNVCNKYKSEPEVASMISAGFRKLIERKHVIPFDDLTPTQQNNILTAESSYFIPWDVGFKETSVSTPARPVFDASSRTSTGYSLNDLLAKDFFYEIS